MEAAEVVAGFWRHHKLSPGDRSERLEAADWFWAWDAVHEAIQGDPADVMALLVAVAEAAPNDEALGYLGAGPVEELIVARKDEVIEDVDRAARRSPAFRRALRHASFDTEIDTQAAIRLRRFGSSDEP